MGVLHERYDPSMKENTITCGMGWGFIDVESEGDFSNVIEPIYNDLCIIKLLGHCIGGSP